MSLRTRIAALTAGAVAVAVLFVAVGAWVLVRRELRQQVDETLVRRVTTARRPGALELGGPRGGRGGPFGGLDDSAQMIDASGGVLIPATQSQQIPVSPRDIAVAARTEAPYLRDERVDGAHLRVLTAPAGQSHAVMLARDLAEVDATLRGFLFVAILLASLGVAGAAAAGLVVARRAVTPVERLTSAAEHVAATKKLDATIEIEGTDELARLGRSFNEMLDALSQSREQQRRLVADASHELRTPLTSLRTNVEVLARQPSMPAAERKRLLADLTSELEELSALVGELVDLATDTRNGDEEQAVEFRLDELVESVVERARRRTGRTILIDSSEATVEARPVALERAVSNLVDNAAKWGPPDEPITVIVARGMEVRGKLSGLSRTVKVEVRDRGPGIAEADRPHVFDRFYRATSARSMPGSGLGLAIVKQVVEDHGGRVWAEGAEDGGARVGFEIPVLSADS